MHLSGEFKPSDFALTRSKKAVSFEDLMPNFTEYRRVGILTRRPLDGLGSSNMLMACIAKFYECYRRRQEEFFTYPDYFTFQPQAPVADYGYFDIWPCHKHVHVSSNGEEMLQAINDRGIDVLLVPDGPTSEYVFEPITHSSAQRRIRYCFLYGYDGQLDDPEITIRRPVAPLAYSLKIVVSSVADKDYANNAVSRWRDKTHTGNETTESYRSISLGEALTYFPAKWEEPIDYLALAGR